MKQLLLSAFFAVSMLCNAQQFHETISFASYEKWISTTKIPDYKPYAVEKDGEAEYNETVTYKATFIKGQSDRLSINLRSIDGFSSIAAMAKQKGESEFEKDNYLMVYVPLDAQFSSAFLAVKLPEIAACLTLHCVPLQNKEDILKLYSTLDIKQLITNQ